jgi:hypothetical protein
VQPAQRCVGATREQLGSTTCAPVGDCAAPFPPAEATLFVSPSGPVDSTHFHSIFAAVLAAPDGATIAIETGTYVENADLTRPVKLVGRCPAQVKVQSPGDNRAGLLVTNAASVEVRGLSLTGHVAGLYVLKGAKAVAEDVVLDGNRWMGAYVLGAGSSLSLKRARVANTAPNSLGEYGWGLGVQTGGLATLEDVELVANRAHGLAVAQANSLARLTGVVLRDNLPTPDGGFGDGATVSYGARAVLSRCAVSGNSALGVAAATGGQLELTDSVVRDTLPDALGQSGRGLLVTSGASARVEGSSLFSNPGENVLVMDATSAAVVMSTLVRGPLPERPGKFGMGVRVALGATLEMARSALLSNRAVGLAVQDPGTTVAVSDSLVSGTLTSLAAAPTSATGLGHGVGVAWGAHLDLTHSAVTGNHVLGLLVTRLGASGAPPTATVTDTLIRGNLPDSTGTFGHGAQVNLGGRLSLERCALVANHEVGVIASFDAELTITDSLVRGSTPNADGRYGDGIIAAADAALTMTRTEVRDHSGGVGVIISGSRGVISDGRLAGNAIALNAQEGSTLEEVVAAGTPGPLQVQVTSGVLFEGNQLRVGTGAMPLPQPFDP